MCRDERPWEGVYPDGALTPLECRGVRLSSLLAAAVEMRPDGAALTTPTRTWTFADLGRETDSLSAMLAASGVGPAERVAVMLPNMPEYVATMCATWALEATLVQVNPAYVAAEVERLLGHSGARVLVTTPELHDRLAGVLGSCAALLVEEDVDARLIPAARPPAPGEQHDDASADVALLQYTGGTTGDPKAVMLTHENVLSNIEQRLRVTFRTVTVPEGASVVNTLPMSHVYGLTCVTLACLRLGINQHIVPRFRARIVLDLVRKVRPFAFFGVPTMYAAFLREPDLEDSGFASVTFVNSAGAGMPPAHLEQFETRTRARVLDGFGLSEASPTTHTNLPCLDRRPGSSGIPVPFTDVRVVEGSANLTPLPVGQVGELALRGPQVMRGYWGDPEATGEVLVDGWLLTGDLVRCDADGFLYVAGRQKDVIVASGYNVYPAEVERVIGKIPGVVEVAVVAKPDNYRGETVRAVVVAETELAQAEILAVCRAELAPYKVPTLVEFADDLPRTPVGKIDKRRLAEQTAQK